MTMATPPPYSHQDGIPSDQKATDAPRERPVLLSLIGQGAGGQHAKGQHIASLASAVTRLGAQRPAGTAAPAPGGAGSGRETRKRTTQCRPRSSATPLDRAAPAVDSGPPPWRDRAGQ